MNRATADSWEDALFHPPPWPYPSDNGDEDAAPTAPRRTNSYGYNPRDLDTLPVQAGYAKPARRAKPAASRAEAVQYYSQFEVIRDIMLGQYLPAHPHCARRQAPSGQGPGWNRCRRRRRRRRRHRRNISGDCSSSAESGSTAVSQSSNGRGRDHNDSGGDSDVSSSSCCGSELDDRRVGATSPQSQASAGSQHATVSAVQWRRSRLEANTTSALVRLPLLVVVFAIIVAEMGMYFVVRQLIAVREAVFVWRGRRGRHLASLAAARSYDEYMRHAMALDAHLAIDLTD
ncbi:hypothetical protein H4R21_005373, partial [Coemansia helicoidea]